MPPRAARFAKTLGKPWAHPRGGRGAGPYFMARIMKILIVEDEPALREVLEDMFSASDHEVKTVATGASGLAALESWPPDVLVTDLGLPGAQGEEVAQAAATLFPRPWIVLMSAEPGRLESARFLADAVLHKPFQMDELMSLIELFYRRFLRGI